jgi:cholesterol transport system auxiliary component
MIHPRWLAAALLSVALGGCGGLRRDAAADRTYVLAAAAAATGAPPVAGVLSVPRPVVQPGLDTERIALTRAGNELDYFAASRWGESLPRVIAALAAQSLAGAGGFATVLGADRGAVVSDYELLLTVRHFEAAYATGSSPVAHVALDCVLTAGVPRRVLGRCDAEARVPAGANRMGVIVAALEAAAQQALAEVRSEAAAAVQAAPARR